MKVPVRMLAAAAALFGLFLPRTAAAQTRFDPPLATYQAGAAPTNLAAGDFDADGRLDLATADRVKTVVRIFYGTGDGRFVVGPHLGSPGPYGLASADVDGDGRADLVAGTELNGSPLLAYLSNGDRTFRAVASPIGVTLTYLVLADLNGDALPDAIGAGPSNVVVALNTGSGSFSAPANVNVAATRLTVGDVNRDTRLDLVAVDARSRVLSILLGSGDGTFQSAVTYTLAPQPNDAAIVDLDGNGAPELVVSEYASPGGGVMIFPGNGDGTFGAPRTVDAETAVNRLTVADFNLDGVPDVAGGISNGAAVFVSDEEGNLWPPLTFSTNGGPTETSGDFNGDAAIDLAALGGSATVVSVILNSTNTGQSATLQPVVWTTFANTTADGSSIRKTNGCDGCFDASAFSQQTAAAMPAALEFTVSDPAPLAAIGLTRIASGTAQETIDFAIRIQGGWAEVRENGAFRRDIQASAGDVFRIAIDNGAVRYLRNGAPFYVSAATPSFPLTAAAMFANAGGRFDDVSISGGASGDPGGGDPGDGGGSGGAAAWAGGANVTVNGSSVTKSAGCDGCFDASAITAQSVDGSGFFEFTAADTSSLLIAGLASAFVAPDPNTIDFGLRLQGGYVEVRESGIYRGDMAFAAGDVFRIEVRGGVVTYLRNGDVFYTSALAPGSSLVGAVAIATVASGIADVTIGTLQVG